MTVLRKIFPNKYIEPVINLETNIATDWAPNIHNIKLFSVQVDIKIWT